MVCGIEHYFVTDNKQRRQAREELPVASRHLEVPQRAILRQ